jgi:signal transduction histidine kinase
MSAQAVVDNLQGERFPPQVETAMFRIVQEALTNVTKYADASRVYVGLSQENGRLRAVVQDNGKGFNVEDTWQATAGRSAFGLLGMYERATLLGGSLDIESRPGNGTRVTAEIPVDGDVGN